MPYVCDSCIARAYVSVIIATDDLIRQRYNMVEIGQFGTDADEARASPEESSSGSSWHERGPGIRFDENPFKFRTAREAECSSAYVTTNF